MEAPDIHLPVLNKRNYIARMRNAQQSLFDKATKKRFSRTSHGGVPTRGRRKLERPLSPKNWIHLVLKSGKATGKLSFLNAPNKIQIEKILEEKARKFGIKIADTANVGNHIHLKIRIQSRASFQKFLKSVTCLIARVVTGARKGRPFGAFWDYLAYTRVLKSYKEELNLKGYFMANRSEAMLGSEARERMLKAFNTWIYKEQGWRRRNSA
jgi:REP element-mobilizing transposase RayT